MDTVQTCSSLVVDGKRDPPPRPPPPTAAPVGQGLPYPTQPQNMPIPYAPQSQVPYPQYPMPAMPGGYYTLPFPSGQYNLTVLET